MIVAPFRVSRGQRQQAGPPITSVPALSSHQLSAVTNKVNRLLTLSLVTLEELDFCDFGNSRGQRAESKYPVMSVVPSLSSRRNTSRGYRWVTRLLPLRTTVARDPKAELRSRHQVEPRGLLLDISHLR